MDKNSICLNPECENKVYTTKGYCSQGCSRKMHDMASREAKEEAYNKAPKMCLNTKCSNAITYKQYKENSGKIKYCSRSCSASHAQKGLHRKEWVKCAYCKKETPNPKFCSSSCCEAETIRLLDERIRREDGANTGPSSLRAFMLRNHPHECMMCKNTEWLGEPIALINDHIDGNSYNNSLSNLRLICPNCDATLPTFKARNKGNGRHERRQRYAEGKSY